MLNLKTTIAGTLIATMLTGCGAISQVNNVRSGYQAVQAYNTAKNMASDQAVFAESSAFSISATLKPREEGTRSEMQKVFVQATAESVKATAERLGLDLAYCPGVCPDDVVRIQFSEQGREGFAQRFAMGDKVGGSLYVVRGDTVVNEAALDMAEDYAKMAEIVIAALNSRLMSTATARIESQYENGEIDAVTRDAKMEAIVEVMNEPVTVRAELRSTLEGKS